MAAPQKPTEMAAQTDPAAPAEPGPDNTVSAEVARGRSIVTDDGLQLAGATVTLDREEARKLTRLGYLVDPGAAPVKEGNGPSFERRA